MNDDLRSAIIATAGRIGANPLDLATTISYETAGTFDPWKKGPTTQWGQHRGLIQWGEPQREKYGVTQDMPVAAQVDAAGNYLQDAGFRPGMGMLDLYSAVNAGRVGRYNASDAGNGGAPGTVADKVNTQMDAHRAKAAAFLGGDFTPAMPGTPAPTGALGLAGPTTSGTPDSVTPAAGATMATPAESPTQDDGPDVAAILKALGSMGGTASPIAQAAAAPAAPSILQPPRQAAPTFDAKRFFSLLPNARR